MKNILIADDHPMILLGLERAMSGIIGECLIFKSGTFPEAWEVIESHDLFLIILDLNLPGSTAGAQIITSIRQVQKNAFIMVYSGRDEMLYAPVCLRSGANGFVHKTATKDELEGAIRMIISQNKYVSPRLKEEIVQEYLDGEPRIASSSLLTLSPREKEILEMVISGLTTKEISSRLRLKYSTVSTHKERILTKMKADNIVDLVKKMSWNDA